MPNYYDPLEEQVGDGSEETPLSQNIEETETPSTVPTPFDPLQDYYAQQQQQEDKPFDPLEDYYSQQQEPTEIEPEKDRDVGDTALTQGIKGVVSGTKFVGDLTAKDYAGAAENIVERQEYIEKNAPSEAAQGLSDAWEKGTGVVGSIKNVVDEMTSDVADTDSVWDGLVATGKNIHAMTAGIIKQTPNMVAPMIGMIGGGVAGSSVGPIGTVGGAWTGASMGNALVEAQSMAIEKMQKAGIDLKDKDAVEGFLAENSKDIFKESVIKGMIIGAVDTATMGVSAKLLTAPAKAASKRALTAMQVNPLDKAAVAEAMKSTEFLTLIANDTIFNASKVGLSNAVRNAAAAGLEPIGEGLGEYAGTGVATGEWDAKNATLEALSSIGQSAITFAGQKAYQKATAPKGIKDDGRPEGTINKAVKASEVSYYDKVSEAGKVDEQASNVSALKRLKEIEAKENPSVTERVELINLRKQLKGQTESQILSELVPEAETSTFQKIIGSKQEQLPEELASQRMAGFMEQQAVFEQQTQDDLISGETKIYNAEKNGTKPNLTSAEWAAVEWDRAENGLDSLFLKYQEERATEMSSEAQAESDKVKDERATNDSVIALSNELFSADPRTPPAWFSKDAKIAYDAKNGTSIASDQYFKKSSVRNLVNTVKNKGVDGLTDKQKILWGFLVDSAQGQAPMTAEQESKMVADRLQAEAEDVVSSDPIFDHMAEAKERGLNLEALHADHDKTSVGEINKVLPGIFQKEGAVHPDEFASEKGYESLDSMIEAFKNASIKSEEIAKLAADNKDREQSIGSSADKYFTKDNYGERKEQPVFVGDLKKGDKVLIDGRGGAVEEYTHDGINAEGETVFRGLYSFALGQEETFDIIGKKINKKGERDVRNREEKTGVQADLGRGIQEDARLNQSDKGKGAGDRTGGPGAAEAGTSGKKQESTSEKGVRAETTPDEKTETDRGSGSVGQLPDRPTKPVGKTKLKPATAIKPTVVYYINEQGEKYPASYRGRKGDIANLLVDGEPKNIPYKDILVLDTSKKKFSVEGAEGTTHYNQKASGKGKKVKSKKTSLSKSEVQKAFPGQNVYQTAYGFLVTLPNKKVIRITPDMDIYIQGTDLLNAEKEHGKKFKRDRKGRVRIKGAWTFVTSHDGLIELNKEADNFTLGHEIYHGVEAMALTKEEIAELESEFGSEEARADAYGSWKNSYDNKLFTKIRRFVQKLLKLFGISYNVKASGTTSADNIFAKIYNGEVWNRELAGESNVGKTKNSIDRVDKKAVNTEKEGVLNEPAGERVKTVDGETGQYSETSASTEAWNQSAILDRHRLKEQTIVTIKEAQDWLKKNKFPPIVNKGESTAVIEKLFGNKEFQKLSIFDQLRVAAQAERPIRKKDFIKISKPKANAKLSGTLGPKQNVKLSGSNIVAADTVVGCDHFCYECYALKGTARAGVSHQHPIDRIVDGYLQEGRILRIGEKGDPSKNWAHTHEQVKGIIARSRKLKRKVTATRDVYYITKLQNINGFNPDTAKNLQVSLDPLNVDHMSRSMENILRIKAAYPNTNIVVRIRTLATTHPDLVDAQNAAVEFANRFNIPILETRMRFNRRVSLDMLHLEKDRYYQKKNVNGKEAGQFHLKGTMLSGQANEHLVCDAKGKSCPSCLGCVKTTQKMRLKTIRNQKEIFEKEGVSGIPLEEQTIFDPVGGSKKYSISRAEAIKDSFENPRPLTKKELEPDTNDGRKFSIRKGPPPKNVRRGFKLFALRKTKDGFLYPLFIGPSMPTPLNIWVDADYIPTKGYADRPGWHFGEYPSAKHLNMSEKHDDVYSERVWAEIEVANDRDWQPIANQAGKFKKVDGKFVLDENGERIWLSGDIKDEIPVDGCYDYPRPDSQGGKWTIGGSIKVLRVLTDKEAMAIAKENGLPGMERESGATISLADYGFDENGLPTEERNNKAISEVNRLEKEWKKSGKIKRGRYSIEGEKASVKSMAGQLNVSDEQLQKEFNETKAKYEGEIGTAPNGKKSNLNDHLWVMTRTPRFKEWFGSWDTDPENASKVVDENGEPLVVYHGSDADVKEFNIESLGKNFSVGGELGFFFSSSSEYAGQYAEGGGVYPAFLVIKKPLTTSLTEIEKIEDELSPSEAREYRLELEDKGYDGVIVGEELGIDEYIAFSPNQIKSIYNTGEFGETGDIRYSIEGYTGNRYSGHYSDEAIEYDSKDEFIDKMYNDQQRARKFFKQRIAKKLGGKYTRKVEVPDDIAPYIGDYGHRISVDGVDIYFGASSENGTIYLSNIATSETGSGVGTKFMNALKEVADETSQDISIYKVTNKKFFEKFDWLEKEKNGDFKYRLPEKTFVGVTDLGEIWDNVHNPEEGTSAIGTAPNGKKSNLNDHLWVMTRTPRFKEWFGSWDTDPENASKVVDENGEPLVVYHGTLSKDEIASFGQEDSGNISGELGSYFSAEGRIADEYAGAGTSMLGTVAGGSVYPVFLNIKNPLDVSPQDYAKILAPPGALEAWSNGDVDLFYELADNGFTGNKEELNKIKKAASGSDGIIVTGDEGATPYTDLDHTQYIAFFPNQIKSIYNTGEFGETGDIRYSIEGEQVPKRSSSKNKSLDKYTVLPDTESEEYNIHTGNGTSVDLIGPGGWNENKDKKNLAKAIESGIKSLFGSTQAGGPQSSYGVFIPVELSFGAKHLARSLQKTFGQSLDYFATKTVSPVAVSNGKTILANAASGLAPTSLYGHGLVQSLRRTDSKKLSSLYDSVFRDNTVPGIEVEIRDELIATFRGEKLKNPVYTSHKILGDFIADNLSNKVFIQRLKEAGAKVDPSYMAGLDQLYTSVKTEGNTLRNFNSDRYILDKVRARTILAKFLVELTGGKFEPAGVDFFNIYDPKDVHVQGGFGEKGITKFSIVGDILTSQHDRISRLEEKYNFSFKEWFDRAVTFFADRVHPVSVVQKKLKKLNEGLDYLLHERLRGKMAAEDVSRFMDERIRPLIKHLGVNKLTRHDMEELALALHVPEANKRLREANAKAQLNIIKNLMSDKEWIPFGERIFEIENQIADGTRHRGERRKMYLDVLEDAFSTLDEMRDTLDSETEKLANREFSEKEIEKGTPDRLAKALEKKYDKLDFLENHKARWDDKKNRLSGMTDEEASSIKEKWEADKRYEANMKAVDMLHDINMDKLDILYEAGEYDQEEYEMIKNSYEHYVPLYREGKDTDMTATTGRASGPLSKPIRVRAGSVLGVVDIFAHTVDNYQAAIIRKHKLNAIKVLYKMVNANFDPERWSLVAERKEPHLDEDGNIVRYKDYKENKNEVFIKVDGAKHRLTVNENDAEMMRFIAAVKESDAPLGAIMQGFYKVNRFLAALNTSLNPEFIISNFFKDFQTANINMEDSEAKSMQKRVIKQLPAMVKAIYQSEMGMDAGANGDIYKDFSANGGKIGWMQGYDSIEDLSKELQLEFELAGEGHPVKKGREKLKRLVNSMNTAVENGIRLATYNELVRSGKASKKKAAKIASDLTVDFTRRGKAGSHINALYMFANAGIQGNVRMIKAMHRSSKVRKIVGGIVMFGAMNYLLNALLGGDDDDGNSKYENLKRSKPSEFERNMIWIAPWTEKGYIKIPMPYLYNAFFVAGNELMASAWNGVQGKEYDHVGGAARTMTTLLNSVNPMAAATLLQSISPTITDPIAQVAENKGWHGGDLMPGKNPFGQVEKPDSERYFKSVNPLLKTTTRFVNKVTGGDSVESGLIDVSPETLEMMIETYTGGLGRLTKDIATFPVAAATGDLEARKIPFVRKIYGEASSSANSTIWRENSKLIKMFKAKYKIKSPGEKEDMRNDPKFKLMARTTSTENRLRKLRKRLRTVEGVDPKDPRVDEIKEQMEKIYIGYNKRFNEVMN